QEPSWRLAVLGDGRHAELIFEKGPSGTARLERVDETGQRHEESWEASDPWPALAVAFEAEVGLGPVENKSGGCRWQDAVRALELDDAARRSLERRRASTLEYPEASEEVGFKGTMTLVGCGMLWGILFL